jgi:hypothetical protein
MDKLLLIFKRHKQFVYGKNHYTVIFGASCSEGDWLTVVY